MLERELKPLLRLKAERLSRGWTQLELAFRARVPVSELSRIETGRSKPYPGHAARLAETLGMSPDELVQETRAEATKANL